MSQFLVLLFGGFGIILNLFPSFSFTEYASDLISEDFYDSWVFDILGYVNFFIPFDWLATITSAYCAVLIVYAIVKLVLYLRTLV